MPVATLVMLQSKMPLWELVEEWLDLRVTVRRFLGKIQIDPEISSSSEAKIIKCQQVSAVLDK